MKLVIVESPAKAKTINKFLGKDFKVIASFGHIRELPSKSGSVDPDNDFEMKYQISLSSKKHVAQIIDLAKNAEMIYLATDPDREGEAISWHINEVLKDKKIVNKNNQSKVKRIAFNEITKNAITKALELARDLDNNLIQAQESRLALDYLVGFTLSPVLWRKLPSCKSAGRVQSVALKLIAEREHEIQQFVPKEYWSITAHFQPSNDFTKKSNKDNIFEGKLTYIKQEKLEKFSLSKEKQAFSIKEQIEKAEGFYADKIDNKNTSKKPPFPFITSSLQQESARKLGFSAKKTMQIAQKLYEGISLKNETVGLITYMRTDGTDINSEAALNIRKYIKNSYGDNYLPPQVRIYKSKSKNAQEAHEAIRPTDIYFSPEKIKEYLTSDQYKLYELVWNRTIACQMQDAKLKTTSITIKDQNDDFTFKASGTVIIFDGFYKVYKENSTSEKSNNKKNEPNNSADSSQIMPNIEQNDALNMLDVNSFQHFTQAQPRYNEASIVKKMEELGIGRPSTYASIISVIQDRGYVYLDKKRFYPTDSGIILVAFLELFFTKYVQYDFTASLENDLDIITSGKLTKSSLLTSFWQDFNHFINEATKINIVEVINKIQDQIEFYLFAENKNTNDTKINKSCPKCLSGSLNLRIGKFGGFIACSNYPECNFSKKITATDQTNNNADSNQSYDQQTNKGNNTSDSDKKSSFSKKNFTISDIATLNDDILLDSSQDSDIYLKKGPYGPYIEMSMKINNDSSLLKKDSSSSDNKKTKKKATAKKIKPKRVSLSVLPKDTIIDLSMAKNFYLCLL
ncbi:MAG TPA: type I DNA topoisomerase [Candidatus Megaira endosymbiont of Hartmannula sinica]|nr:type I DNA topoisomerase [Candidatus Megaera endosymbiont of Hartmannula sinica]